MLRCTSGWVEGTDTMFMLIEICKALQKPSSSVLFVSYLAQACLGFLKGSLRSYSLGNG